MKRKLKSVLSCLIVLMTLFSTLTFALPVAKAVDEFEPENASPLIVTEVVTTGPTNTRYTYTEIYNNSSSPINFKDYKCYYWYTTSLGYTWSTNGTDVIIEPGKCIILWYNDGTKGIDLDDFNAYYGVNLVNNVDIYMINFSGVHATGTRGFRIGRDPENIITEAWCNQGGADVPAAQNGNKLGVHYTYPRSGIVSTKQEVSLATPGTVYDWQVPETSVDYDTDAPAVVSASSSSPTVGASQPFTATATIDGMVGAMNVYLNYKQAESLEYLKAKMERISGTTDYTVTLDRTLLWGDDIIWYVEASYGAGISGTNAEITTPVEYAPMDDEEKAPFVITEIVTPPGTGQQWSYIEIYNRTNQAINYGFYNLYYLYPSGTYLTWPSTEPNVMVEPGKPLVLWLSNNGSTVAQFNAYHGSNLRENEDIVRIDYGGLHQSDERTMIIGHTYETPIVKAKFNENGADLVAGSHTSIQYTYPRTADNQGIKVSTDTPADPGVVEAWQVPASLIPFRGYEGYSPDDGSSPSVVLTDAIEPINEGDELNVTFDIGDTMGLTYMAINYRLDGQGAFKRVYEATQRVKYNFFARIPADILFGHDYVEFFVEGYNLFRKTTTETYRVDINRINDIDGVRLNVSGSSVLSGNRTVTANAGNDNSNTKLFIDDEEVLTKPVLENGAYFALTLEGLNSYFKNALTATSSTTPNEVLSFFSKWSSLDSRIIPVDNKYFSQDESGNYDLTLSMWAGDSGTPFDDIYIPSENRDDYTVTNLQLRLANGKNYLPIKIEPDNAKSNPSTAYDAIHTIGDSSGMSPRLDISFHIPAEEVTAVGYELDTTAFADGTHTVKAVSGAKETAIQIVVDNTRPQIDVGVAEDSVVNNQLSIDPEITDDNGIARSGATLDGEEISIPYTADARDLSIGEHELVITAIDAAGNIAQKTVHFKTEEVDPNAEGNNGGEITTASAKLSVNISELNADTATVEFMQGKKLTIENGGVTVESGYGTSPLSDTGSASAGDIPYELYTINAATVDETDTIRANWAGSANYADASHAIKMYVLNFTTDEWERIGTADSQGKIDASFAAGNHLQNEKAYILIQGLAMSSAPNTATSSSIMAASASSVMATASSIMNAPASPWDGTSRPDNYDFAFAWMTDTQYYVESWPYHFYDQNEWLVDIADEWKVRYTIHTGDLVDEYELNEQWLVADKAMKILDDAGMPYGVLGGNHDVAAGNQLYGNYWKYFGEQRFMDNPWYGDSYNNNLGHYDLLTENGQDFIVLYMSWDIYENEINWMNEVLEQYSDRIAIICLHRYTHVTMTDGTYLDYAGKMLQENVVAKNPNVIAVINGHYHGSSIETTAFDDNNDGVDDRQVYQICTDYQSDVEGGSEYIKFLYFDLQNNKIYMNSYSPYRQDFNYFDTPRLESYAAGTKTNNMDIFELDVGFDTAEKVLTTQNFDVQLLSDSLIGKVENVVDNAEYVWEELAPNTTYGWYAKVTNEKGGVTLTQVQELTTTRVEHKVTVSAGAGGSISNPGVTMVADGGDITFTIAPHAGYRVDQLLLDGQPVSLTDGKLTLSNVIADHTISVSFKKSASGSQNPGKPQEPVSTPTPQLPVITPASPANALAPQSPANSLEPQVPVSTPVPQNSTGPDESPSAASLPAQEVTDSASGAVIEFSEVALPADITDLTMHATLLPLSDSDESVYNSVEALMREDKSFKDFSNIAIFDIKLLNQDGQAITNFNGKIKVRIPVPTGMSGDLRVLWYDDQTGAVVDMGAVLENGYLVFETDHLSYYVVSQFGEGINTTSDSPKTGVNVTPYLIGGLLIVACAIGLYIAVRKRQKA